MGNLMHFNTTMKAKKKPPNDSSSMEYSCENGKTSNTTILLYDGVSAAIRERYTIQTRFQPIPPFIIMENNTVNPDNPGMEMLLMNTLAEQFKLKINHAAISHPLVTSTNSPGRARSTKKPRVTKYDTKTGETVSTESLIQPAKEFIDKASTLFGLNYTEIVSFLDDAHGSPNPLSITQEYTKNITGLLVMLTEIYPKLEDRRIKSRITRIRKKMRRQLNLDKTEGDNSEDTDVSQEYLN
uniref:Uncharacterized protein LOC114324163 n=1 Tax=Diabrotica virgifera virgifera TaxID=50390 RepID=A0A6P7EXJ7_DIAVI